MFFKKFILKAHIEIGTYILILSNWDQKLYDSENCLIVPSKKILKPSNSETNFTIPKII